MTTISINLFDSKSIRQAKKQLEKYNQGIYDKCAKFTKKLMDVGISVGKKNCGEYSSQITFRKKYENTPYGFTGTVEITGNKVIRTWRYKGDYRSVYINALLMAEFGSGFEAEVIVPNVEGQVGQGTFPDQKHAFDEGGWTWTDENNVTHHSMGETPTHPAYYAWMEMKQQINSIALQVFKNGK